MGTGLGPESYAIIEQGRIGQILSSKPQDRRAVIEEAAGITKFKTRKRLAEAKLEGAKQNLARVYDILEEVTRQVNSLKRQASKAQALSRAQGRTGNPPARRPGRQIPARWSAMPPKPPSTLTWLLTTSKLSPKQVVQKEQAHESPPARLLSNSKSSSPAHASSFPMPTSKPSASAANWQPQVQRERRHRAAHRPGRSRNPGAGPAPRPRSIEEISAHRKSLEALEAQTAQSRTRMLEINQQRDACRTACASARRPSNPAAS